MERWPANADGDAMRKASLVDSRAVRERGHESRTGLSRSGVRVGAPRWALVCRALVHLMAVSLVGIPASAAEDLKFTSADESRAAYDRTVKPFFARHCVECHGEKNSGCVRDRAGRRALPQAARA